MWARNDVAKLVVFFWHYYLFCHHLLFSFFIVGEFFGFFVVFPRALSLILLISYSLFYPFCLFILLFVSISHSFESRYALFLYLSLSLGDWKKSLLLSSSRSSSTFLTQREFSLCFSMNPFAYTMTIAREKKRRMHILDLHETHIQPQRKIIM